MQRSQNAMQMLRGSGHVLLFHFNNNILVGRSQMLELVMEPQYNKAFNY